LKHELDKAMERRDAAYTRASQCHLLRRTLRDMVQLHEFESNQSGTTPGASVGSAALASSFGATIQVDLGCSCYVQVEVPDASVVLINIGCGVIVPMNHAEANQFLVSKEALLKQDVQRLTKEILRLKYRIRLVIEAISRLHDAYVRDRTVKPP
jgi:prefoldin subunit 5